MSQNIASSRKMSKSKAENYKSRRKKPMEKWARDNNRQFKKKKNAMALNKLKDISLAHKIIKELIKKKLK